MKDLNTYKTWIFDCDGVLLHSNAIKSDAFYEVALPYGEEKARLFVEYHKKIGGISRLEKFRYFLMHILKCQDCHVELEELLAEYGKIVKSKLLTCPETDGMRTLLEKLPSSTRKIVVSGGLQEELREVFSIRKLHGYFNEIFGSPDSKETILRREVENEAIIFPAVFVGDSRYDFECARMFSIDFIMMTQHLEFENWMAHFQGKDTRLIYNLGDLLTND